MAKEKAVPSSEEPRFQLSVQNMLKSLEIDWRRIQPTNTSLPRQTFKLGSQQLYIPFPWKFTIEQQTLWTHGRNHSAWLTSGGKLGWRKGAEPVICRIGLLIRDSLQFCRKLRTEPTGLSTPGVYNCVFQELFGACYPIANKAAIAHWRLTREPRKVSRMVSI